MKQPWFKFFPGDWRQHPKLRSCSLAAQGLWIALISRAHQTEPYGHVVYESVDELALDVGRPLSEVKPAFEELERRGVFSRVGPGDILSRRMIRDAALSEVRSEAGTAGAMARWNGKRNGKGHGKVDGKTMPQSQSQSQSQKSESDTVPSTEPAADKPPRSSKPRKPATGPNADLIRHWEAEWPRTRMGQDWAWTPKEAVAVANALKLAHGDVDEVRRRMTRLLESPDAWVAANAAPSLLASKWNQLAVTVAKNGNGSVLDRMIAQTERTR